MELRETLPLSDAERQQLARTSPHALRHTFGTQAVAADVPLDVVQRVLSHASLQTTTVAEQRRMRAELGRYFGQGPTSATVDAAPAASSPSVPVASGDRIQGADPVILHPATVRLTLVIRNANKFGRGRKRAIEDIESWVRDDYAAVKVAADEYDLQVPYETERELDDRVYALLDDIHRTADDHHCFSESCACLADSDRCWA